MPDIQMLLSLMKRTDIKRNEIGADILLKYSEPVERKFFLPTLL